MRRVEDHDLGAQPPSLVLKLGAQLGLEGCVGHSRTGYRSPAGPVTDILDHRPRARGWALR